MNHDQDYCPLCSNEETILYHKDRNRNYRQCTQCRLVFVPRSFHLSPADEKAEYDLHENNPEDEGYRKFLSRLSIPLQQMLSPGQNGLDFGCGPGPTLSRMMEEKGFSMDLFDPYYQNNQSVFQKTYTFITATEVLEHIAGPSKELPLLLSLLKPGGILAIMTKMVRNQEAFKTWHYTHDPTHIRFYSRETFEFIADRYGYRLSFSGNDVVFLQKE